MLKKLRYWRRMASLILQQMLGADLTCWCLWAGDSSFCLTSFASLLLPSYIRWSDSWLPSTHPPTSQPLQLICPLASVKLWWYKLLYMNFNEDVNLVNWLNWCLLPHVMLTVKGKVDLWGIQYNRNPNQAPITRLLRSCVASPCNIPPPTPSTFGHTRVSHTGFTGAERNPRHV